MHKLTISYEEYEKISNIMSDINMHLIRIPTKREIDMFSSSRISFFLPILIWLVEDGIADNDENEFVREYINDKIDEDIEKYMIYLKKSRDVSKVIFYTQKDFNDVESVVSKIDFIDFSEVNIDIFSTNQFKSVAKYSFGLLMFIKIKNNNNISDLFDSLFVPISNQEKAHVSDEKYNEICDALHEGLLQRDDWLPTEKEIYELLIPNISVTYDFILWILNTGKEPETVREKYICSLLDEIVEDYLDV